MTNTIVRDGRTRTGNMGLNIIVISLVIFVAFTIGLNLGLHGIIISFPFSITIPRESSNSKATELIPNINIANNHENTQIVAIPIAEQNHVKNTYLPISRKESSLTETSQISIIPSSQPPMTEKNEIKKLNKLQVRIDFINKKAKKRVINLKTAERNDDRSNTLWRVDVPIVLLTCNRPELLRSTLDSLLEVRGVKRKNILVSQDGVDREVKSIAEYYKLSGIRLRGANRDGAERIARHYKYSLSSAFDRFRSAEAVIVIEDDLLFSPDFYEYFKFVSPILQEDSSVFAVSAWNDNGFKRRVKDVFGLRRTVFFPGLGWLLTRKLYKEELEQHWPKEHWDHWLRSPEIHRYREVVHPEVPRSYHNGIKGTFMNLDTHNKYFRDIAYNTNKNVSWRQEPERYKEVEQKAYEYRVEELIKSCKHLQSASELSNYKDEIICIWIKVDPDPQYGPPAFRPMATFFGIWHEFKRGAHFGLQEFYFSSNYILIINLFKENLEGFSSNKQSRTYEQFLPSDRYILNPGSFEGVALPVGADDVIAAKSAGISCDRVCEESSLSCNEDALQLLNDCKNLLQYFSCSECHQSLGPDQPAYVVLDAPSAALPGHCLANSGTSTCSASHPHTIRLCACTDPNF